MSACVIDQTSFFTITQVEATHDDQSGGAFRIEYDHARGFRNCCVLILYRYDKDGAIRNIECFGHFNFHEVGGVTFKADTHLGSEPGFEVRVCDE